MMDLYVAIVEWYNALLWNRSPLQSLVWGLWWLVLIATLLWKVYRVWFVDHIYEEYRAR